MAQELRKVSFALNFPQGFLPDGNEQAEIEDFSRFRNGFFHGITEVMDDELKTCQFVIEDEETGKVYYIDPRLVRFIK